VKDRGGNAYVRLHECKRVGEKTSTNGTMNTCACMILADKMMPNLEKFCSGGIFQLDNNQKHTEFFKEEKSQSYNLASKIT